MKGAVVAVILAGGLARRMGGGDKPLRLLAGRPLLDHVLDRIRPQVADMVLNANGDPGRFAAWNLEIVADTISGYPGPLAGILAGMRWAALRHPDAAEILSVPGDTPFLPVDLLARLTVARRGGTGIAFAAAGGKAHPTAALWPLSLADVLESDLCAGARRVKGWASRHGAVEAVFEETATGSFLNINRNEDLAEAEAVLARG